MPAPMVTLPGNPSPALRRAVVLIETQNASLRNGSLALAVQEIRQALCAMQQPGLPPLAVHNDAAAVRA